MLPSRRLPPAGRSARRILALVAVLFGVGGCGESVALGPVEECPERSQAGLVAATSCAPTHGAVEGRVVDGSTGRPLVGAIVATSPATNTALTDSDGGFEIEGIPLEEGAASTEISVTAVRPGYRSDSRTVSLRQDAGRATIDLSLAPIGSGSPADGPNLSARVTHRDAPFAGAAVDLIDAGGAIVGTTPSDANGFALFADLDAGTYTVRATATIAGRPFRAVEGVAVNAGSAPFVELDLRQVF